MKTAKYFMLFIITLIVAIICLNIGRYIVSFSQLIQLMSDLFTNQAYDKIVYNVIVLIRLPRILVSLCVGTILSIDGVAFQGIFKNPLASSQILGVSSGASFGAAFAIVVFNSVGYITQLYAFAFGMLSVGITYIISKFVNSKSNYSLLLCGIVTGTFFSALLSILTYMADSRSQLPTLVFWLMGSMNNLDYNDLMLILIPTILLSIMICSLSWKFNILTIGDNESKNLGINPYILKGIIISSVILCTSITISICGTIGWVGLLVPHAVRLMVGTDNKKVFPYSIFVGAIFLMIVDTVSRSILSVEIPIGIIINVLGAPLFMLCLFLNNKKNNIIVN